MQISVVSPYFPRAVYYKRLPQNSPTRLAIEKYLFTQEGLSTEEALEIYRYLRDFSGARLLNYSLRRITRDVVDQILYACLDAGADPF